MFSKNYLAQNKYNKAERYALKALEIQNRLPGTIESSRGLTLLHLATIATTLAANLSEHVLFISIPREFR